ncbi:MAG: hypothetical protein A3G91_00735 [Omnitrophica WOR_2 bacterium RIFCSPLOWO2_12_FULL_50_9]|nr:MAG: hypothetical protein A3D87_01860 [Omnitrophica WOR_2 bacterium RIFCSPHIGHO2_02_FULL_50_17]OGX42848.1 MAG: hypothetical protein A3G91_00735 [Omnitrophica WOR_2 bacterium RIFCSPLOWO2_12_FULL_50_9]
MKVSRKVLLVYKKSAYSIYFAEREAVSAVERSAAMQKEIRRFQNAHNEHHTTLERVECILQRYGINYAKCSRGQRIDFAKYDFIISVGGDGTFLEAARGVTHQIIIGVNSAPSFSVGKLCVANEMNFEAIIQRMIDRKIQTTAWQRLRLRLKGHRRAVDCVNDALICHSNPAAMSRYYLKIKDIKEEQRNSGLWVATSAGSSGAIKSAGGKILMAQEKKIQYMPRELYEGFRHSYRLKGGILSVRQVITVTSLMHEGMIFVDGTHFKIKFPFNAALDISLSPNPLRTVKI